jgi:hypothetical protein
LSEHSGMENSPKSVQKPKKRRSRSDKIGRLKYNQQLLKRVLNEVEDVKLMQRTILTGLKGYFRFEQPVVEKIACVVEIDREILHLLFERVLGSALPFSL